MTRDVRQGGDSKAVFMASWILGRENVLCIWLDSTPKAKLWDILCGVTCARHYLTLYTY